MLCPFFVEGRCKTGNACHMYHNAKQADAKAKQDDRRVAKVRKNPTGKPAPKSNGQKKRAEIAKTSVAAAVAVPVRVLCDVCGCGADCSCTDNSDAE